MKNSNTLKRLSTYAFLPALLLTATLSTEAAIFLKLDGIDGESNDANHENWIDVLSVGEGVSSPSSGTTGTSRRRGTAVFDDVNVGKVLDKSSPKLREALAMGKIYPTAIIELTATCGGGPRVVYFKYELTNVALTSVSLNATGSETRPVEEVSFNFEEIKWTYTVFDNGCTPTGVVEASWKLETGTP